MTIKNTISRNLFKKAKKLMPGGVNSPVRSFNSVGGTPHFMVKGEGPFIYDEDNNKFTTCDLYVNTQNGYVQVRHLDAYGPLGSPYHPHGN